MTKITDLFLTAALLALCLSLGGAGVAYPLVQTLLYATAVLVACIFVVRPRLQPKGPLDRWARLLIAAIVLLPLVQLIPLPPSIWLQLPGREVPAQVDHLLGRTMWRPWTLDVERTVRAWLILIPAATVFAGCLRLHSDQRRKLLWIVAVAAMFNALLGLLQLASGGSLTPFASAHLGAPLGLFVNRNHSASLFLAAMPIVAFLGAMQLQAGRPRAGTLTVTLACLIILAVLVIGTTSRMALALLPLALLIALFVLFSSTSRWRSMLPATLTLAAVGIALFAFGGLNRSLMRFSSLHDARFDYWTDISWALRQYGLAGTGFGTFIPVYQSAESLRSVTRAVINHAHNDYFELLLEGGLVGMSLLVGFAVIFAASLSYLLRAPTSRERILSSVAACGSVLLLLLFSVVDFPLRMPALSALFAVLCTIVLPSAAMGAPNSKKPFGAERWSLPMQGIALTALLITATVALQAGMSARALLQSNTTQAKQWAPWSTHAFEQEASAELARSSIVEAAAAAHNALRWSPISTPAIRTIGLAELASGRTRDANQLLQIAAELGWRDVPTQLWTISAARQSGEVDKALMRAEALFQQGMFDGPLLTVLLDPRLGADMRSPLVNALAARPEWRRQFLKAGGTVAPRLVGSYAQIVLDLRRSSAPPETEEVQPLVDRLIKSSQMHRAQELWAATRPRGFVANGDFEQVGERDGIAVPAQWDISSEDLSGLSLGSPAFTKTPGRSLKIFNTRSGTPIISQQLMLQPGGYELLFRSSGGRGAVLLKWTLTCFESAGTQAVVQSTGPSGRWQVARGLFTVPNLHCPIQRLALQRVGDIHPHEVWLDDVALNSR